MLFDLPIFSGGVYSPSATLRTISFSISNSLYFGVWINRQVTGHNHVNHLEGKPLGLQNLARGGKFWRDEEGIKAGLTMWEVVCKPVLNYGAEVWTCSSKTDEQR